MENNPYRYDPKIARQMPRQHTYNSTYSDLYVNNLPGAPQAHQAQANTSKRSAQAPVPARMPKVRALALARLFKQALVVTSLAAFASFSGLVAYHQINTSSSQKSTTSPKTTSQQNNTFFNQQGGNNLGTSTPTATASASATTSTTTSTSSSGSTSKANTASSTPASGSHTS
ncbi:MAG TPA: hypothetical protein VGD98_16860 [Ktedonobacteraceae bacterium]